MPFLLSTTRLRARPNAWMIFQTISFHLSLQTQTSSSSYKSGKMNSVIVSQLQKADFKQPEFLGSTHCLLKPKQMRSMKTVVDMGT